MRLLIEI